MRTPNKTLNAMQQAFVDHYVVDMNATRAAEKAGYKAPGMQAHRLMKNVMVAKAIAAAQAKRAERVEVTQDYVLSTIVDTVERCRQQRPVLDKRGEPVMVETAEGELAPAYTFEAASALRGLEMLGKHLGMFVDRVSLEVPLSERSDDELLSELQAEASKLGIPIEMLLVAGGTKH